MPQATDELRAKMEGYFGDPVDDAGPLGFLRCSGFVLNDNWSWTLPSQHHVLSEKEKDCLLFLIEEWDFDGLAIPVVINPR